MNVGARSAVPVGGKRSVAVTVVLIKKLGAVGIAEFAVLSADWLTEL